MHRHWSSSNDFRRLSTHVKKGNDDKANRRTRSSTQETEDRVEGTSRRRKRDMSHLVFILFDNQSLRRRREEGGGGTNFRPLVDKHPKRIAQHLTRRAAHKIYLEN